ncbi:hypothetical protein AB0J90_00235 [Micromonospora sp. NPDC049523]|uniref:hypothetical protein n=1 Tax=Micromonospora sp. NPDC049523 TaxID=3155921 RepID=UPI003442807B
MAVPTIDPNQRDPHDVVPTDSYQPTDPVWIFRSGTWRAGVVEVASAGAATVTYRPSGARGTGVDTLTARYVLPRADLDPLDAVSGMQRRLDVAELR